MQTRKIALLVALIGVVAVSGYAVGQNTQKARVQPLSAQTKWVAQSLKEMETVRVGMTRAQLLKVFTTEKTVSSRGWRTYVYRHCPYFKVDAEFRPVGNPDEIIKEDPRDVITKISKPYIQWTVESRLGIMNAF